MLSCLSLFELLALGGDLPEDWRHLTRTMPDEHPLLFRWLEFARVTPPELARHFWIPLEWRGIQRELVVVPWSGSTTTIVTCQRLVIPAADLAYFRLYRTVGGRPHPEPLQADHPHFHPELRKAG